jgi:glycosyltransferase involved in cell wall biosynthesis
VDRSRERALAAAGADLTLVLPASWPDAKLERSSSEGKIVELPISRAGDVNRHEYKSSDALRRTIAACEPDVLDIHEEPFSRASKQWLAAAPIDLPVVMYTAQNVDKRYPPPFAQYERRTYRRVAGLYPCSQQAASVARGKGFDGLIEVLPLGYDDSVFYPGAQSLDDEEILLGLIGRLVPEKGVLSAVQVLARVNATRPARLLVVGRGPEEARALDLAKALGVADRVELLGWRVGDDLAATYRAVHVVLVPSHPTQTWVEQFGRVIIEAQASGAVVAAYASGAIPEVAGDAAILTDVGDAELLADRVVDLLTTPASFARMRDRGIESRRDCTWASIAQRQTGLYRRVVTSKGRARTIRRSPKQQRAIARAEFGPTAATATGTRPFALPILREGGLVAATLARLLDESTELGARTMQAIHDTEGGNGTRMRSFLRLNTARGLLEPILGTFRTTALGQRLLWIYRSRTDPTFANLLKDGTREERFAYIYETGKWGTAESRSGVDSSRQATDRLRAELINLLEDEDVETIFDAGCGDFNWMREIRRNWDYTGGDIVPGLIEELNISFGSKDCRFVVFDIVEDIPAKVDLIICRDVLFHLPNADVWRALVNFKKSASRLLLYLRLGSTSTMTQSSRGGRWPSTICRYCVSDGISGSRYDASGEASAVNKPTAGTSAP